MAKRRCISIDVFNNDIFLDLEASTKVLYVYFILNTDDDGFVVNPKTVMRLCGANDSDLDTLIVKNYIIPFDNGVLVIKHWNAHNKVQPSKRTPTVYQAEFAQLAVNQVKEYYLDEDRKKAGQVPAQYNSIQDNLIEDNKMKDNITQAKSGQEKIRGAGEKENPDPALMSDEEFNACFFNNRQAVAG